MDALTALKTRRSVKPKELGQGPGPTDAQLQTILEIATRVPDHGKLAPWKILVLRREGQEKLGRIAAERFTKIYAETNEAQRANEAARFTRAPLVLAVLSTPKESVKAPRWEQEMSAAAVCTNILHACHAMGFGACWLTEWVAFDPAIVAALLQTSPLRGEVARSAGEGAAVQSHSNAAPPSQPSPLQGEGVKIAGFIYIGEKVATPDDRERPAIQAVTNEWK